ncbi:MAG: hypothetical protein R3A44_38945 [Caldilineaceae bacterium]
MLIRLGVYDLFAYTVPGGFYLSVAFYILQRFQIVSINYKNFSTTEWIIFVVLAYVTTFILNPIAGWIWHRTFRPKNLHSKTKNELKERNPGLILPLDSMDWYIALAYIRHHNVEASQDIQHINSLHIMLRNLGLSFICISVVCITEFIITPALYRYLVFAIIAFFATVMCARRAVVFNRWYYEEIYQTVAAMSWQSSNLPIRYEPKPLSTEHKISSKKTKKPIHSNHPKQK